MAAAGQQAMALRITRGAVGALSSGDGATFLRLAGIWRRWHGRYLFFSAGATAAAANERKLAGRGGDLGGSMMLAGIMAS